MKEIFYGIVLLFSFTSFGQEVFKYDFDENLSLNVVDDTEEGEMANGKYLRGTFENEVITFSSSNKAKDKMGALDEVGLLKIFQGVRDGNLKSTKGKLISEEILDLRDIKVSKFKILFSLEGKNKVFESYIFAYKNIIYTFQFMNNEKEFEKLNGFRKSILDSITFK